MNFFTTAEDCEHLINHYERLLATRYNNKTLYRERVAHYKRKRKRMLRGVL